MNLVVYVGIAVMIAIDEHERGKLWVREMRRMPRRAAWDPWWAQHAQMRR